MFEKTKDNFYQSLSRSIKNRKEDLGLKRTEILKDERRISKIVKAIRNKHYPYLICSGEYPRLNCMFMINDREKFMAENDLDKDPEEIIEKLIEKFGTNYDEMLWGHIDWDKMFEDVITELSKSDNSEELDALFEDTLVDYVPYAAIRYDELPFEYGKRYIFPDERERTRQNAIEWVHLRHGSSLFKQTFYEKFSGKTLREFDKGFHEFVSDYLEKRKPNDFSLGLQAYNYHKSISRVAIHWQSLAEVQYGDIPDTKSDIETLYEEYLKNSREQMKKLEKFQQKFDNLHININSVCVEQGN